MESQEAWDGGGILGAVETVTMKQLYCSDRGRASKGSGTQREGEAEGTNMASLEHAAEAE